MICGRARPPDRVKDREQRNEMRHTGSVDRVDQTGFGAGGHHGVIRGGQRHQRFYSGTARLRGPDLGIFVCRLVLPGSGVLPGALYAHAGGRPVHRLQLHPVGLRGYRRVSFQVGRGAGGQGRTALVRPDAGRQLRPAARRAVRHDPGAGAHRVPDRQGSPRALTAGALSAPGRAGHGHGHAFGDAPPFPAWVRPNQVFVEQAIEAARERKIVP